MSIFGKFLSWHISHSPPSKSSKMMLSKDKFLSHTLHNVLPNHTSSKKIANIDGILIFINNIQPSKMYSMKNCRSSNNSENRLSMMWNCSSKSLVHTLNIEN